MPPAAGCEHGAARALLTVALAADDPDTREQLWTAVSRTYASDMSAVHAAVTLGTCTQCGRPVATVRVYSLDGWTLTSGGLSWSTPWAPLLRS